MVTELILVLPVDLSTHMVKLIPVIQFSHGNNQNNINMEIDTLSFIQCLLTGHHPTVFHPHAATLVPAIISVSDYLQNQQRGTGGAAAARESTETSEQLIQQLTKMYQCCVVSFKVRSD